MPTERFRGLDDLRVFVVFLVVVLHAALSYMAYAPDWWYVLDPEHSLLYTYVVLAVDVPIMLIMFFLAGFFTFPSIERRGRIAFLKEKVIRIALPWIFGVMVLAPPTAYMIYWTRNAPVSLFGFWTGDFWGVAYQQSVYWFLGVLFALFVASFFVHAVLPPFARARRTAPPPVWLFPVFVAVMIAGSLATAKSVDFWSHNWLFSYQPARVPLYVGYFVLGIWADRAGWFGEGGWMPSKAIWVGAMLATAAAYLGTRMLLMPVLPPTVFGVAVVVLFNLFCFASLGAGLAFFAGRRGEAGALSRSLARSAYGVYYVHPLILYPLAWVAIGWPISIHLKMPAVTLIAWLVSWAVSALLLTRLPVVKRMF